MEKRNIQISLEEAIEWYNSGNSFKRELALKAYSETELSIKTYINILALLKDEVIANSKEKAGIYRKLLNIAKLCIAVLITNLIIDNLVLVHTLVNLLPLIV